MLVEIHRASWCVCFGLPYEEQFHHRHLARQRELHCVSRRLQLLFYLKKNIKNWASAARDTFSAHAYFMKLFASMRLQWRISSLILGHVSDVQIRP